MVFIWARCGSLSPGLPSHLILEGDFEFGSSRLYLRDRHCALWRPGLYRPGKPGETADHTNVKAYIDNRGQHRQRINLQHSTIEYAGQPEKTGSRPADQPRTEQIPIKLHVAFRVDRIDSVDIRGHLVAMEARQVWTPNLRREQEPAFSPGSGQFPAPKLDKPLAVIFTWLGIPFSTSRPPPLSRTTARLPRNPQPCNV